MNELRPASLGFNGEWSAVESLRNRTGEIYGWRFAAACGKEKKYLDTFFTNSYQEAVNAMNRHRCS